MSIMRPLLNAYLRWVEKPRLRRTTDPATLRRALEVQAKWMFFSPRGTQQSWQVLEAGQRRIDALEVVPKNLHNEGVIFYIHGGGFVFGSPRTHAAMVAHLAKRLGARAVLPQYRLAPEAPFPAAVNDVRAAWDGLLASGVDPSRVIVGGDSAGGTLALGLLSALAGEGGVLPAGVFCLSPLTDMTFSGESFQKNSDSDVYLVAERADEMTDMYLNGHSRTNPRISPLLADFTGAGPVWITVGDTEILYDDSRRMAAHLSASSVDVTLIEKHDLPHVWPIMQALLPEGRQTLDEIAHWVRQLPGWPGGN
tara:strand:+ start:1245 stop:2171 length:927 start_codon:yes stop_codon:yes gene_type:complete